MNEAFDEITRLALAARGGDRQALAGFLRATQGEVRSLCAHIAGPGVADDLTQEVFLRAWRGLPRFRADASARTWVLGIARHVATDSVRAATRRRDLLALVRPARVQRDTANDRVMVNDVLDVLDRDRRLAFVLTQLLGLSYAEAAEVCGCAVGTIRSRLFRARADLVESLGRDASPGTGGAWTAEETGSDPS